MCCVEYLWIAAASSDASTGISERWISAVPPGENDRCSETIMPTTKIAYPISTIPSSRLSLPVAVARCRIWNKKCSENNLSGPEFTRTATPSAYIAPLIASEAVLLSERSVFSDSVARRAGGAVSSTERATRARFAITPFILGDMGTTQVLKSISKNGSSGSPCLGCADSAREIFDIDEPRTLSMDAHCVSGGIAGSPEIEASPIDCVRVAALRRTAIELGEQASTLSPDFFTRGSPAAARTLIGVVGTPVPPESPRQGTRAEYPGGKNVEPDEKAGVEEDDADDDDDDFFFSAQAEIGEYSAPILPKDSLGEITLLASSNRGSLVSVSAATRESNGEVILPTLLT
eukprot:comp22449_c0_seq1/m.55193 comp22449_c0_seq1/g.55193  ORF comp22449_c0_seq1/g.55193 comp22449_c0_seq1/m.55193 type:complete len:346 (+) comp22449_c0_seq1:398-1435(+)